MKKILLIIVFAVGVIFCADLRTKAQAAATTLPDIRYHWARSEIEMLISKGVVEGRTDNYGRKYFYPEAKITRAEFVVMLINAMRTTNTKVQVRKNLTYFSYEDTHNHWAEPFVEAATDLGITGGVGDGKFKPEQPITRSEIAVMLVRAKVKSYELLNQPVQAQKYKNLSASVTPYSDVDKDLWFYKTIMIARNNGLISGNTSSKFKPFANATRAETAAMIARFLYVE